jgi:riboflavin-specific deaminase-like protein
VADHGLTRAWDALLAAAADDHSRAAALGLRFDPITGWADHGPRDPGAADLIALYLPFIQPLADQQPVRVIAHLGQSLDGCVATDSGDACFVTGEANIVHLHRMRALADAIIVGAGTVANDDPQLTTRLVPGPNAVRVVIDPDARLSGEQRLFQDDACPTLHCCRASARAPVRPQRVERLPLPDDPGADADACGVDLRMLCERLGARGLRRLFVEGGGVTVSRFLRLGLLERLQITVAPLIIGRGRRGVSLPGVMRLSDALRPASRAYRMGADVLYDLSLVDQPHADASKDQTFTRIR